MKASVGDRVVIASNRVDHVVRDGTVVELRHEDGSPPYVVEWADTGSRGLFFPGPDAHLEAPGSGELPGQQAGGRRIKTWRVEVSLYEEGDDTTARAVLVSDVPGMEARGAARRNPADADVPVIGDEVAVARALRRLSDLLLGAASDDISAAEGRPVALRP